MKPEHQTGSAASNKRYQMLDVWRGLVCLLVVLEHAGVVLWSSPNAGGSGWDGWLLEKVVVALRWNLGSLLFFVMSGFCIASSLDASRRRGSSPGRFLYRRFWRIYPTYWAALLLFFVFVAGSDVAGLGLLHRNACSLELVSPGALDLRQWLGNLTLTETWRPRVTGGDELVFTRVAWSLCYQEQFYLVCVLALWLTPARIEWALAGATAAIVAFRLVTVDVGVGRYFEGMFPIYWHLFAVGLAVFWRLNLSGSSPAWARRGMEAGLAVMAVVGFWIEGARGMAAPVFGLLLIALYRWDGAAEAIGWLKPVRACGRRSYSIYLIHLPVTTAGNVLLVNLGLQSFWARLLVLMPLVVAASVGVGWAFHHLVERHFLGQPPTLGLRARVRAAGAALARPVAVKAA